MTFLARMAGTEYLQLLMHELALPFDLGAPDRRKSDIAPDRDFSGCRCGDSLQASPRPIASVRLTCASRFSRKSRCRWRLVGECLSGLSPGHAELRIQLLLRAKARWPEQFWRQVEIRDIVSMVADAASIRPHVAFETEVISMTYDDAAGFWLVETRDKSGQARTRLINAVITATGQLNRPAYPEIAGLQNFGGQMFHWAR